MSLTVITVKNAPNSLRGDLTKWMQEIATGVYIGNFNVKIRDNIWKRVKENIGNGEATISFTARNEIGYDFITINSGRKVINYDGIPLVFIPDDTSDEEYKNTHFSDAYKLIKARFNSSVVGDRVKRNFNYVVVDIETDGLDENINSIIEIGAIKVKGDVIEEFHSLIYYEKELPKDIVNLTDITSNMLKENGIELGIVLDKFIEFIEDYTIVGYGIDFDLKFLRKYVKICLNKDIINESLDLMKFVKKEKILQKNYKLETSLKSYGIEEQVPHRALDDARLIYKLSTKVNKFKEKFL